MSQSQSSDPHDNPQGPGDARPTARQIAEREAAQPRLQGKKVVLTGAASGIGTETAKVLAELGCELYLPVRDPSVGDELIQKLVAGTDTSKEKAPIHIFEMDLSDLDSVRRFADELKGKTDKLNILINNAG